MTVLTLVIGTRCLANDADTGLPVVASEDEERVERVASATAKRYAENGDPAKRHCMTEIVVGSLDMLSGRSNNARC